MPDVNSSTPSFFQQSKNLLLAYFLDEKEGSQAKLTLFICLACILIMIGLGFVFSWWCLPAITAAFIAKNSALLMINILEAIGVASLTGLLNYITGIYKNKLQVSWSYWLKTHIQSKYISRDGDTKNFIDIAFQHKEIDSPSQRMEEIDNVVESFLNLTIGFIENLANLILYTVLLCCIGGSVQFAFVGLEIIIPQFPVITAFVVGIGSTLIGYWIARKLQNVSNDEITAQTALREHNQIDATQIPAIVMEDRQDQLLPTWRQMTTEANEQTAKRLAIENKSNSFHVFNVLFQVIVPFLASAQMFFKDLITLDIFISLSYYFSMITYSLNFFIYSLDKINQFLTSLKRVVELYDVLLQKQSPTNINFSNTQDGSLEISNFKLDTNTNSTSLKIEKQHTLVLDRSGDAIKMLQTVYKVSKVESGDIKIPTKWKPYFGSQDLFTPPNATLEEIIKLRIKNDQVSDDDLNLVFQQANLESICQNLYDIPRSLDKNAKSKIVLAQALLDKSLTHIFLDNVTAGLDDATVNQFYEKLKKHPNAVIISISSEETLQKYHDATATIVNHVNNQDNEGSDVEGEEFHECQDEATLGL